MLKLTANQGCFNVQISFRDVFDWINSCPLKFDGIRVYVRLNSSSDCEPKLRRGAEWMSARQQLQKWLDFWPKTPRRSGRGDVLIRTWSFSDPVFALNFVLTVICGQSLFWPLKRFDFKISKPFCRLKKPERVFNLFCRGWPSCLYCHYGPENNQKNRIFWRNDRVQTIPIRGRDASLAHA